MRRIARSHAALVVVALGFGALGSVAACGKSDGDRNGTKTEPQPAAGEPVAAPSDAAVAIVLPPAPPLPPTPPGLPELPASLGVTPARVALGRILFFDTRLSSNGTASCATCHDPNRGWADGADRSPTVAGRVNLRHTPTLFNVAYADELFWDGRVTSLERMIIANWKGQLGGDPNQVAALLADIPRYAAHFDRAFGAAPTGDSIAEALAAFVRTIRIGDDPSWTRYEQGDLEAVSADAVAGFQLFSGRAQCSLCHPPPLYTNKGFHDLGIGYATAGDDPGRANATGKPADRGKFRTPTIRGAALNPPYFHDGSINTLGAAVDYHLAGGPPGEPIKLIPVGLTDTEKAQLLAFIDLLSPVPAPFEIPRVPAAGK